MSWKKPSASANHATNDAATVLDRVIVEYGGQSSSANLYVTAAAPTVRNSVIRNSSAYGLYGPTTPASTNSPIIWRGAAPSDRRWRLEIAGVAVGDTHTIFRRGAQASGRLYAENRR